MINEGKHIMILNQNKMIFYYYFNYTSKIIFKFIKYNKLLYYI